MKDKWFKSVGRNAPILIWSADMRTYKKGIQAGPLVWSVSPSLVIRNGTPLTYEFELTEKHVWTNLDELLRMVNTELPSALEALEKEIALALTLRPVASSKECGALYDALERNGGLMLMGFFLTSQIYERIRKEAPAELFEKIKDQIAQPYKKTMPGREHDAIELLRAQLGAGTINDSELAHKAQELAEQYGFIHAEYVGEDQGADAYINEIKNKKGQTAVHEESIIEINDPYIKWLAEVAGHMAFVFDEAKISFIHSMWCIRKTAHTLGLNDLALVNLTADEFQKWTETGVLPSGDIKDRSRYYVSLLQDGTITESFDRARVMQTIQQEGITEFDEVSSEIKELRGAVAYKGLVRGRARITLTQQDSKRVEEGDILIASMTTAELLSAMKRAAAFVTDEGGITCHAAIIAREFKKPCIIGTQIATKVFKDGDMVEVDAEKGIVRKI